MTGPTPPGHPSAQDDARRALWDLSAEAAGIGTFILDPASGRLTVDDRLLELSGLDREVFGGTAEDVYARVHPDDVGRVVAEVQHAIDTGGAYRAEYRVVVPGDSLRWLAARGQALVGDTGATTTLLGAVHDVTALHEATTRVTEVLESMLVGYLAVDAEWRVTHVNGEAERVLGTSRQELVGTLFWESFPAAVGTDFEANYRRAVATGTTVTFDAHYPAPLDAWFEVRAHPERSGLGLYFLDITERRRAQERAELLAEVTGGLSGTLDAEEAATRLAQLVVPALADWCVVGLVDDADDRVPGWRRLRDVGWQHRDPAQQPLLEAYAASRTAAWSPDYPDSPYGRALATGRPVQLEAGAAARIARVLAPGPARDAVLALAPERAAALPLRASGRTLGMLTLYWSAESVGSGDRADAALDTARDLAARCGLALDNAHLYRQQRRVAEGLQRSLLSAPPEPDHAQVVVRYTSAAEAAQVGGDWYDAFLQPAGTTVVAIGDVLGHDTDAAAAMSSIRSMLRGIAVHSGAGPADVLRGLDQAMVTLQVGTTATAVVVRLEQTADEARRGITQVHWSNAGHPPPMAINPDGTVLPMLGLQSELLLGLLPGTERTQTEITLDRGATLLLYTDGLVERRDQSLERGLVHLRRTLEQLAAHDLSLDDLCDELLARMLPRRPEDDVALIAVRLHRQDRLRPAEAGPNRVPPTVDGAPDVIPQPG